MSRILINEENEKALILERNGLLKNDTENETVNELKSVIKESTSDLPLGKALNLLVNIHIHIFDKAVSTIQESSPTELALKIVEMPTVRALISIGNYLTSSDNISISFKHIYDSLQEKFIKRSKSSSSSSSEPAMRVIGYLVLHSKHQNDIRQCIIKELSSPDKRIQLAAVVLMQFLFTNYISSGSNYSDLSTLFIPPLVQISEKYGDSPTLLACSSCELALQFSRYIALHLNDQPIYAASTSKITEIDTEIDIDKNDKIQQMTSAWKYMDKLLYIMEKWRKSIDQLETVSYKELHLILYYTEKAIEDKDHQKELMDAWDLITTYLTPKSIISEKPLSLKKQKSILLFKNSGGNNTPLLSSVKILLLILLQKGRLVELYGSNRTSIIYTKEEEEVKELFMTEYINMVQSYPIKMHENFGKNLIPKLLEKLPFLCTSKDIDSAELIQVVMDRVGYQKDTLTWILPLIMKQPESSICNLLLHVLEQDEKSKSSYDLLGHLISQNISNIINILESNLLSVIKSSNQACELLIQCMTYTHLSSLIQKLMAMTVVDNEREKMTYIALISKALLHEKWASSSILLYLELIRDFKLQKGFVIPVKLNPADLKKLTPSTITSYKKSTKSSEEYGDQEVDEISINLIAPIQLWSTKIDENSLKSGLIQLVHKSYGLPRDTTCIDAWRYLSFAFLNNHSLIWGVVEQCLNIMKSQILITQAVSGCKPNIKEAILFLRISPMLILQTIPKEAFDVVKVPKSYIDLLSIKIQTIKIDPKTIKLSSTNDKHTQLCIQLMDELLLRSLESPHLYNHLDNPIEFSIALLTKIFCK